MKAVKIFRKGINAHHFALTLILVQFIFLTNEFSRNPIRTPVTDDWLYLNIGAHRATLLSVDSFELINGHQQVLVKSLVWVLGFLPGLYFSYVWYLNVALAFLGIYLLIGSQNILLRNKMRLLHVLICVITLCNFKPLYLYMSVTGTGLCLTMLFFGIYYYASNKFSVKNARIVKTICAFLAPFATGFGISLAGAHLIELFYSWSQKNSFNISKRKIFDILIIFTGLTISYILPTFYNILNSRSPESSTSKLSDIFDLIWNPMRGVLFIFGLLGATVTPSSRFDPMVAIFAGVLIVMLISWNLFLLFSLRGFISKVLMNQTPLLGALIFMLMLVVFRGSSEQGSLSEAVVPRYVMGTSLTIFSLFVLILEKQNTINNAHIPLTILSLVLVCSLSGLKTGLEWLSVRNLQTSELRACLDSQTVNNLDCIQVAQPIKEGESSDADTLKDLEDLSKYLTKVSLKFSETNSHFLSTPKLL
jgi:hypothetical protein